MDNRPPAIVNDTDSDWDDDSTLDFTSPRQQKQGPLTLPYAAMQQDDNSELSDSNLRLKERSNKSQNNDNGETGMKDSKTSLQKARVPESSSVYPATDSSLYDFKGSLTDERKLEGTGHRSAVDMDPKGNKYTVKSGQREEPGAGGSENVSDEEARTLRDLNATLKKEKMREHRAEEQRQKQQQKRDADRQYTSEYPGGRLDTERNGQGYDKHPSPHQPPEHPDISHDAFRGSLMSPYNTRDVHLEMLNPEKYAEDGSDVIPTIFHDEAGARVLYNFKPCNMKAYEVPDTEEEAVMPGIADKGEKAARRIWQEFFGALRFITNFIIIFIIEAVKYVLHGVAQPIIMGVLTSVGNYLLKPLLSLTYSMIIQPVIVFSWNVLTAVRHLMQPVIDILHGVLVQVAMVLRAFRLFDVTYQDSSRQGIRNV